MTDQGHKKPRWPMIAALVLLPVLYVLSWGPAFWFLDLDRPGPVRDSFLSFYLPIFWLFRNGPDWLKEIIDWYGNLW